MMISGRNAGANKLHLGLIWTINCSDLGHSKRLLFYPCFKGPKMLGICLHVIFAVDQKKCCTSLKLNSVSSFWFSRHWNKGMQVELEDRPWPCNGIRSLLSRHHCHAQHMLLSCCLYCYHKSYRHQHHNDHILYHYNCKHNSVIVFLTSSPWMICKLAPLSSTWKGFS